MTPFSNRQLEETVATAIRNINVAGVFAENLRNELTSYVYKPLSESSEEFTTLKTLYDDFLQSGNLDKFYSQFYTSSLKVYQVFFVDFQDKLRHCYPLWPNTSTEKVLGIIWNPVKDSLCFEVKLNFSSKKHKFRIETDLKTNPLPYDIPEQLTKRINLSQVNSIYYPLGLAGPFTVGAKIMIKRHQD